MDNRDLNFLEEFGAYDGCVLPGVRLPQIDVEEKYYAEAGLDKSVGNFEFLSALCNKELERRGLFDSTYKERLDMELQVFKELDFVDYVLLNWDILKFCHENGIPTGSGRGSAASSLVLFLLDVTKVDPIKYGLFFERFVNKARAKKTVKDGVVYLDGSLLPDVDNDISYNRRLEVIQYIEHKHPNKTSKILTLNTLSGKLCVKECGKIVAEFSEDQVNLVSDLIPKKFGRVADLVDAYKDNDSFRAWADENAKVYSIAVKIEGLNKNTGVHPSGIAISYFDITDIFPVQKTSDGELVSGYDMNYVAELAVKFDVLGLRTLTVVDMVCKDLGIEMESIDPNNPEIYQFLQNLRCPQGLFQIEAETNYKVCKKVAPKNLEQLSAVISIARPGALVFADQYADFCRSGESKIVHPFFSKELSYTGGIPLYQEQLLQMLSSIGFAATDAERVRKIIGKKLTSEMPAWQQKIKDKVKDNDLDPEIGDVIWKVAEDSANYSFNRCLNPDTIVETENGQKKTLQDLNIGERIRARNVKTKKDHFVTVLAKYEGLAELFEVQFFNGKTVQASLKHKFLCEDGQMRELRKVIKENSKVICNDGPQNISIAYSVGTQNTIDIEVDSEEHNFYAQDIVVSNSHSVSYSFLAARTAYLKFKYPQHFFLALLKLSKFEPDSHDEINKISKELCQFNIRLLPPDLAKSDFDFKIEGDDIRFGLNSIKGVSEKTLEALQSFRETKTPNKFDIFLAAKQAGINIGLLSSLIQAGTLSSYTDRRSRLVLEAQTFNILTDKEKTNAYTFGERHNWDILTIINEHAFKAKTLMPNGKQFLSDKRCETIKNKYREYKKIYDQNKNHEKFANWVFEYKLLGYTPSTRLRTVFEQPETTFTDTLEFQSVLKNERVKIVGIVQEVYKSRSAKTDKVFYRFTIKDEVGSVSCLFMDTARGARLSEYLEDGLKLPEEDDIVVFTGRVGDDVLWTENIAILNDKIFMKLSDIK